MKVRTKVSLKRRSKKWRCNIWTRKMAATNTTSTSISDTVLPDTPSSSATPLNNHPSSSSTKALKVLKNKSEEKLQKSVLNSIRDRQMLTRSNTLAIGMRKTCKKILPTGNSIIDVQTLAKSIASSAICGKCKKPKSQLQLLESPSARKGLCQQYYLICNLCKYETKFFTSKRLAKSKSYDINQKSTHASCQGLGHSGLLKLTAQLDLPKPVTYKPYQKIVKDLHVHALQLSEKSMVDAAKRLFDITERDFPENIIEVNGLKVAKVAVSVDGTWQRRGFKSKHGVVFVISVDTGEVLDAVVKSLYCHECENNKVRLTDPEFQQWYRNHQYQCNVNHEGSSGSMEASGATEIFKRSMATRNLMYNVFVGDGDSDCFGKVKDASVSFCSEYIVVKEECIGHIQKRLGSALREYKKRKRGIKLADGKAVGGQNRLTDYLVDQMQNYYGYAIRNNSCDLEAMQNAIMAVFYHTIKSPLPLEEQHRFCPKSDWCKFWSNKEQYDDSKRLPVVFHNELLPIFTRLSNDELLKRCLRALTQNANECVNGTLWRRCPKSKFCGKVKLELALAESICEFNTGCGATLSINIACGGSYSSNMHTALKAIDQKRIADAARKITEKYRRTRQQKRAKSKMKRQPKTKSYKCGSFGLSARQETYLPKAPVPDTELVFVKDSDIRDGFILNGRRL